MRTLLLSLLTLTACTPDVCTRAKTINEQWRKKNGACFSGETSSPAFDTESCRNAMSPCTDDDETRVQNYFDCLEALPACTPDTRDDFNAKALACGRSMNQLSDGCFVP